MSFRKLILVFGLCTVLLMAGGCTGAAGEEQSKESEISEERQTEEETVSTEAPEAGTEAAEAESAQQDTDSAEAANDAPLRIYGTITEVGEGMITVENQSDASSSGEMILDIDPENTVLADGQTGLPLTLEDVQEGSFEAYLSPVMTMSLPPHTVPYVVVANISENSPAPKYAVLAKDPAAEDGGYSLEATDGRTYTVPEDVEISAFRTKNIVTLEDLTEGSGCLVWTDGEEAVSRIVLLEGETQASEETPQT